MSARVDITCRCGRIFTKYRSQYRVNCSYACHIAAMRDEWLDAQRTAPTPVAPAGARWLPVGRTGRFVLVDADRYEELLEMGPWQLLGPNPKLQYATKRIRIGGKYKVVARLHREVIGAAPGEFVDHINRNTLDCRRANLRIATMQGNNANRGKHRRAAACSRYKGVCRPSDYNKWLAVITTDSKTRRIGCFATEIEAALAYDRAAREHWGEFAAVNFPNRTG